MRFLLLSILSSTFITLIFKLITRRKIDIFSCIVVNYIVACLLGFAFANYSGGFFLTFSFVTAAVIVGILFILTFRLIGLSTLKSGMGVTSIASKMSLAIPITISFIFDSHDTFTPKKAVGVILAIAALALTTYKKDKSTNGISAFLAPIILFLAMGVTDSSVKLSQLLVIPSGHNASFTVIVFGISAAIGVATLLFSKRIGNLKERENWIFGAALGIANYCSLLFFLFALNSNISSSVIFGINNIGIVILSVLIGIIFFKERLSATNTVGVVTAIISLIYLSTI